MRRGHIFEGSGHSPRQYRIEGRLEFQKNKVAKGCTLGAKETTFGSYFGKLFTKNSNGKIVPQGM
jgi:hypothetical protein